ncbi:hypothetical protein ACQKKX_18820 [Neorhizobium sp. NPDC001467]|uniref:hypothetical protein n=1 Tax=Neorhizobium sp. NPDC001467 TaxID=3390595 RepID=UPI003D078DED
MQISRELSDFLRRFDHFNDSVIESISVDYASDQPLSRIRIVLTCQDDLADKQTWRRCVFDFRKVQEFRIGQDMNRSSCIISFGLAATMDAGLTYVDFNCLGDTERTIDQVRSSGFFIGAETVRFGTLDN